jgi:rRNA-processing protein FCF1
VESVQLTPDVISNLNDEQLTILQELGELAAKKLKVSTLVEQFTQQIAQSQSTMGFKTKERPDDLHEDPEVISLVTIKERYKITNIDQQIRRTLRRAVDVGLGHLAIIQRQCRVYGIKCEQQSG